MGAAALRRDLRDQALAVGDAAVGGDDVRAEPGEGQRRGAADAAAGARDHHHLALELAAHAHSPVVCAVIPGLVPEIQLSAGSSMRGWLDPGDKHRDDNHCRNTVARSTMPFSSGVESSVPNT